MNRPWGGDHVDTLLKTRIDHAREFDRHLGSEIEYLVADEPVLIHVMPEPDGELFLFSVEMLSGTRLQWLYFLKVA